MGTLTKLRNKFKESKIGPMLKSASEAFLSMMGLEEDDDDISVEYAVESAIKANKNDPQLVKDLKVFLKEYERTEKGFKDKIAEKDEDGYNKIPNKVGDISAVVSEEKAIKEEKQRAKGGKQRTRVDED